MKNFKTVLFCFGLFFTFALTAEKSSLSQLSDLEYNIKYMEGIIADATKNLNAQKKLLALLERQLAGLDIHFTEDEDDETCDLEEDDHRLTLRIPKRLIAKIDKKRKQRVGRISRNLWILEILEKAVM